VWIGGTSGEFLVKFAYVCLANQVRGPINSTFKQLWQVRASPNVLTTTWRVILNTMPTRVSLMRRG